MTLSSTNGSVLVILSGFLYIESNHAIVLEYSPSFSFVSEL